MNLFVTSDHHFWHENIIRYCNRPFDNVHHMNEALIERWNSVVKPEDHVYHLGDVTIERGSKGSAQAIRLIQLLRRLNGHKRLILGNHDHYPVQVYLAGGFEKVRGTGRWYEGCWFSHFPIHPASMGNARACIHGHIHNNEGHRYPAVLVQDTFRPYINVSVEVTAYAPLSWDEIADTIRKTA